MYRCSWPENHKTPVLREWQSMQKSLLVSWLWEQLWQKTSLAKSLFSKRNRKMVPSRQKISVFMRTHQPNWKTNRRRCTKDYHVWSVSLDQFVILILEILCTNFLWGFVFQNFLVLTSNLRWIKQVSFSTICDFLNQFSAFHSPWEVILVNLLSEINYILSLLYTHLVTLFSTRLNSDVFSQFQPVLKARHYQPNIHPSLKYTGSKCRQWGSGLQDGGWQRPEWRRRSTSRWTK